MLLAGWTATRGALAAAMNVGGYDFRRVGDIEPITAPDGSARQFMPQERYKNVRMLPLNRYGAGPFCKFTISSRFQESGVYFLMIADEIKYAGECVNLSARFNTGYGNISPKNCFKGGQDTNCRLNNLVFLATTTGERISLWFFPTADYKAIEAVLRSTLKPAWNRV
jgi:hypothetical protein